MKFTNEITNEVASKQFLKDLQDEYPGLHLEFDFTEFFNNTTNERTFTDEEAHQLDLRTNEVYEYIEDPMSYVLELNELQNE
jgi:hypothetical protein